VNPGVLYLDASALVKLVIAEPESEALLAVLSGREDLVTSAVAVVEVVRAARRVATSPAHVQRAHHVLGAMNLLAVDRQVLDRAAELEPATLRALDAIHLASALSLEGDLDAMVVYDRRLADAAESFRLRVLAPR